MAETGFDLFESDGSIPLMPSLGLDGIIHNNKDSKTEEIKADSLKSQELKKVIQGDSVNTIMAPTETTLIQPNYLLDLGSVVETIDYANDTLKALLDDDGDVAVYTTTYGGGIVRLGFGLSSKLDMIISSCITALYDGECRLYKNVEVGKKPVEIKRRDISTVRLKL